MEFGAVEAAVEPCIARARRDGQAPELFPVIKTPGEVAAGTLLFLDMIDDGRVLYDREGFLQSALEEFTRRLAALGAKRIWRGHSWHWDFKADGRPGDASP
jgi:hypothetical protein